jgi:peptidoglycan/LPS O-acetylase OafA/YrhL
MHGSIGRDLNFHAARVPALDGIRGIAILLVFAVHTAPALFEGGVIGVDLFFVLSGFLITSILLQEHRHTGAINLFNFYMRRALRLFPAVVLMTTFVVTYAYLMQPHANFGRTLWNATGVLLYFFNWQLITAVPDLYNHQWMFSHVWSLSVEEQFYIVWPTVLIAAFAFGSTRSRFAIVGFGIVLPTIARAIMWRRDHSLVVYFNTFCRLDGLMSGALAAMLIDARLLPNIKMHQLVSHSTVAALGLLLIIAWPEGLTNGFLYLIGFALVGLCSAILIYGSVVAPSSLDADPDIRSAALDRQDFLWPLSLALAVHSGRPRAWTRSNTHEGNDIGIFPHLRGSDAVVLPRGAPVPEIERFAVGKADAATAIIQ